MTKFFNKFKNPHFWPIFGPFSRFFSYRFLAPCQNLGKTNNTNPRKHLDRREYGRKDGRSEGHKDPIL